MRPPATRSGMLRRSATSRLLSLAFAGLALIGCALPAAARTRPHYGGTLRVEIQGDPWQMPDGLARRLVLDTLITLDDSGAAQPALAAHWESQNNAHRWELQLRSGVRFADGSPLTTEAVVSSLQQACSANPCPWIALHAIGSALIFVTQSPT